MYNTVLSLTQALNGTRRSNNSNFPSSLSSIITKLDNVDIYYEMYSIPFLNIVQMIFFKLAWRRVPQMKEIALSLPSVTIFSSGSSTHCHASTARRICALRVTNSLVTWRDCSNDESRSMFLDYRWEGCSRCKWCYISSGDTTSETRTPAGGRARFRTHPRKSHRNSLTSHAVYFAWMLCSRVSCEHSPVGSCLNQPYLGASVLMMRT